MAKIATTNGNVTTNANSLAVLKEDSFSRVLCRERKRAERTGEFMLLLLVDVTAIEDDSDMKAVLASLSRVQGAIRETDICGWVKNGALLGIIFTGILENCVEQARQKLELKIRECFLNYLALYLQEQIRVSLLLFPEDRGRKEDEGRFSPLFYPEIFRRNMTNRGADCVKRVMDVVGSIVALLLFSPLFIIIPILIKLTSPGPVFFRQVRLGRFGKPFTFLKFRSMQVNNDDSIHREFINAFIDNKIQDKSEPGADGAVFKIKNDPRLTPIGNFLRKSSIDELPQFFNVLKGEMSLVGPRPPIPYEVDKYGVWHWYRVLARKPGITGLWQVEGRSLTTFDGMVRLDLQYIRTWSLWLDIKLLLATPMAVLRGKGAY
jgi:exopolysaccharide biosynthesis polyprenyl glycosylphosphotransferase